MANSSYEHEIRVKAELAEAEAAKRAIEEATGATNDATEAADRQAASETAAAVALEEKAAAERAATDAANDGTKSSNKAADASKTFSDRLNQQGEQLNRSASAGRIFSEVLRGNFGALASLGSVLQGVSVSAGSLLLGLGGLAAAFAGPAIIGFKNRLKEIDEFNKSLERSFEETTKEAEELAAVDMGQLQAELSGIKTEAESAAAELANAFEQAESLAAARKEVELLRNQQDGTISEVERTQREAEINLKFTETGDERRLGFLGQLSALAQGQNANAAGVLSERQAAAAAAQKPVDDFNAEFAGLRAQILAIDEGVKSRIEALVEQGVRGEPLGLPARNARDRRAPLVERLQELQGEEAQQGQALAGQRAQAAQKELEAATKLATESAEKAAAAERRLAQERESLNLLRPLRAEAARLNENANLATAAQADATPLGGDAAASASQLAVRLGLGASGSLASEGRLGSLGNNARDGLQRLLEAAQAAAQDGTTGDELRDLIAVVGEVTELLRGLRPTESLAEMRGQLQTLQNQVSALRR